MLAFLEQNIHKTKRKVAEFRGDTKVNAESPSLQRRLYQIWNAKGREKVRIRRISSCRSRGKAMSCVLASRPSTFALQQAIHFGTAEGFGRAQHVANLIL